MIRLIKIAGRIAQSNVQELPLPYRLTYSVTNRCQAHCAMCNIWQKSTEAELTLQEIDLFFSKANHFSWINLTGGELFQHPDIINIFNTVIKRSKNLYILNFPTNGYQTDEIVAAVNFILNNTPLPRLIISVSLDGPAELHDRIRGISGIWEMATQTFARLHKLRSSRFSVYFGYTVQTANLGRFSETLLACQKIIPDITVNDFHFNLAHTSGFYYNNADTDVLSNPKQAALEIENIRLTQKRRLFDPVFYIENRYQQHIKQFIEQGRVPIACQAAAASCYIDSIGTVYPCTTFAEPLGSLREYNMDLCHIWRSAPRLTIRRSIRNGSCPGCWTPCEAYQTLLANLLPGKTIS